MQLTLGYSPCPNDTFLFDALVNGKIDTQGISFRVQLGDVEELNKKAERAELDITKLSYHAFAFAHSSYALLYSGSALGRNCGPLLITRQPLTKPDHEVLQQKVNEWKIAIPGELTTANFLLGIAFPNAQNKIPALFSEIEKMVLINKADAGLIIHENRFTYQGKGLHKVIDLGEFWETTTGRPIPLGGIAIKRNLPDEIQQKVNHLIRKSVEFAFKNPDSSLPYVSQYAQEMDPEVMKQHIKLYVNDFTVNLGNEGIEAVEHLYKLAQKYDLIPSMKEPIFINRA